MHWMDREGRGVEGLVQYGGMPGMFRCGECKDNIWVIWG